MCLCVFVGLHRNIKHTLSIYATYEDILLESVNFYGDMLSNEYKSIGRSTIQVEVSTTTFSLHAL